ncbi:hypothetical protein NEOLEDRAFT_1071092 [Neolentinus lepideus HHB14362 ss-1]|uniref:MOSC domain-containing protein n=1 Tax=Neolentinus lepideus HHB14362 ss-1 TaxID=1314782 RepID=A0A165QNS8_9AGAM|nr:hypothetical protein NEOLEDRAFT_1071092 [Neolentinus lepideus HHB14362 ss-1]
MNQILGLFAGSNGEDVPTREVGPMKISQILVHPIKARLCRGTSVQQAKFTPQGLQYDREWCLIDPEKRKVLTAREIPKMVLITPTIETDPSSPDGGTLTVSFPLDSAIPSFEIPLRPSEATLSKWDVLDGLKIWSHTTDGYLVPASSSSSPSPSSILSEYTGRQVQLVYKGPAPRSCDPTQLFPGLDATVRYQDGYPWLVCSEEALEAVRAQVGEWAGREEGLRMGIEERWKSEKVPMERFRPNIVLSGSGVPFIEDSLEEISILPSKANGNASETPVSLVAKCPRCLLPNVDPQAGVRDKAVPFKVLMKFRTGIDPENMKTPCFGCNGVPHGEGLVCVGDEVSITKWIEAP